MLCNVVSFQP